MTTLACASDSSFDTTEPQQKNIADELKRTKPLRVVFAGTPEFAAISLEALIRQQETLNIELVAVYTQPDRKAGRGQKLSASSVKQVALTYNIPVEQPETFKKSSTEGMAARQTLRTYQPDLMIVAAYGLILPIGVLITPTYGCLNIHASLLPRWRGAAPIQRAIEAGDAETGVCIMQMDAGLDTGAIISEHRYPIKQLDTATKVHDELMELGAAAIVNDLKQLQQQGYLKATPQPEKNVTYAAKLSKEEARINWHNPAEIIERKIRSFNPVPGAWVEYNGKPLKIWRAEVLTQSGTVGEILSSDAEGIVVACGNNALRILELQPAGSKTMDARSFIAGRTLNKGDTL